LWHEDGWTQVRHDVRRENALGALTVLLLGVGGLAVVKWIPYYDKALIAFAHHSIGNSILTGGADRPPAPSLHSAFDYGLAYGKSIWKAMALGLLVGSAVQTLLRRATPGAAIAFWLGNTVLNPATLVFTGFVLGWHWSIFRLAFGALMVFGLGFLANHLAGSEASVAVPRNSEADFVGQKHAVSFARWLAVLYRMSIRLIPEYLVLVLALGAARAWLFPHMGREVDDSLIWIFVFASAGALFVIPTAGEVPIVQAMLALGIAVGPAAALLMTLPPISIPSLAMLRNSFRPRLLVMVSFGVVMLGSVAGLVAKMFLP
jgi:uncharacterized membrane protein YraQ (UPF0718 family)